MATNITYTPAPDNVTLIGLETNTAGCGFTLLKGIAVGATVTKDQPLGDLDLLGMALPIPACAGTILSITNKTLIEDGDTIFWVKAPASSPLAVVFHASTGLSIDKDNAITKEKLVDLPSGAEEG